MWKEAMKNPSKNREGDLYDSRGRNESAQLRRQFSEEWRRVENWKNSSVRRDMREIAELVDRMETKFHFECNMCEDHASYAEQAIDFLKQFNALVNSQGETPRKLRTPDWLPRDDRSSGRRLPDHR